jgi:hypothetical protein
MTPTSALGSKPNATSPAVTNNTPSANAAQRLEQRLSSLLARIRALVAPGGLTSTRADLAAELYVEATKLAPSDGRVRGAPTQIADAYLTLARARAATQDHSGAQDLVRRGLDVLPGYPPLTTLQRDLAERQRTHPQTSNSF